jgi:D-serine deaminase-like pyridoxal phosphate-dependent protein
MQAFDRMAAEEALQWDRISPIPPFHKGFGSFAGQTPEHMVRRGVTIRDLGRPLAMVNTGALDRDITLMASYCRDRGVQLAPHIKTTMAPQIFIRQMSEGAWAATVATVEQGKVAVAYGVRRLLVANELARPSDVADLMTVVDAHPGVEVLVYADSAESVRCLTEGMKGRDPHPRLGVLIEMGINGGRAGVRTVSAADEVARAVAAAPGLDLRGVAAFEGVLGADHTEGTHQRIRDLLRLVVQVGALCAGLQHDDRSGGIVLSAGGSVYFDLVADELTSTAVEQYDRTVVLRSGAYVVHDQGYLGEISPLRSEFQSALTVRADVLSVPESGLAIIGAGKRDLGSDIAMPTVTHVEQADECRAETSLAITTLNDQHAYARWDDRRNPAPVVAGSVVRLAVAHPCTTFDRWRLVALTSPDGRITDIARTHF